MHFSKIRNFEHLKNIFSSIITNPLNINLEKIEALEGKIKSEMVSLKEKMSKMEEELLTYSDLVRI